MIPIFELLYQTPFERRRSDFPDMLTKTARLKRRAGEEDINVGTGTPPAKRISATYDTG